MSMEITTDPVFIKDSDINIRGNIVIELCREIDKRWIGEALGAQKFHQVWKIYSGVSRISFRGGGSKYFWKNGDICMLPRKFF